MKKGQEDIFTVQIYDTDSWVKYCAHSLDGFWVFHSKSSDDCILADR
jgi:hypothetical protein